jgi:putative flippase GtrA
MIETTDRLPMLKMLGVFLGLSALVAALTVGFSYFWPDVEIPNSVGIATSIVASMQAGMFAARRTNRLLTRREKLVFAAWATAASALVVVGFYWGLFAYYGVPFTMMTFSTALLGDLPNASVLKALPWILLFGGAASLLVIYFGVGLGAKTQLKALERKAAKAK